MQGISRAAEELLTFLESLCLVKINVIVNSVPKRSYTKACMELKVQLDSL